MIDREERGEVAGRGVEVGHDSIPVFNYAGNVFRETVKRSELFTRRNITRDRSCKTSRRAFHNSRGAVYNSVVPRNFFRPSRGERFRGNTPVFIGSDVVRRRRFSNLQHIFRAQG